MRFFKKLHSYFKILFLLITRRIIRRDEYHEEYNLVAPTYDQWIERMHKYTDEILVLPTINTSEKTILLDLACGTGYISKKLLETSQTDNLKIVAVDISEKMIEKAKNNIQDTRCSFVIEDGMDFIKKEPSNKYHAVFCGFALPYFDHKELIKHVHRILIKSGSAHFISNCFGTLRGLDDIFKELIKENPRELDRIMEMRFKLPKNEFTFKKWFERKKFKTKFVMTREEIISFSSPEALFNWLKETGAIAGTGKIFQDDFEYKEAIIEKFAQCYGDNGSYSINHKFVLGIFQKQ